MPHTRTHYITTAVHTDHFASCSVANTGPLSTHQKETSGAALIRGSMPAKMRRKQPTGGICQACHTTNREPLKPAPGCKSPTNMCSLKATPIGSSCQLERRKACHTQVAHFITAEGQLALAWACWSLEPCAACPTSTGSPIALSVQSEDPLPTSAQCLRTERGSSRPEPQHTPSSPWRVGLQKLPWGQHAQVQGAQYSNRQTHFSHADANCTGLAQKGLCYTPCAHPSAQGRQTVSNPATAN